MIYILYGPPGSGKTTIARSCYLDEMVSHTTRDMREGEIHGVDYYFITEEEWKEKYENGDFIEHTEYHGNYYSLSKEEVEKHISKDNDVVCVLDDVGVDMLRRIYGEKNIRSIYVNVPYYTSFIRVLKRDGIITAIKRTIKALMKGEFNNFGIAHLVLDGRRDVQTNLSIFERYTGR